MDQTYKDKSREQTRSLAEKMSLEELSYTLGRYCGRSNQFLSEKKFGFILDENVIREEMKTRDFEEAIFGTET